MTITLNGTTGITSTGITETSDGKVGIGTSSPAATLHIAGSSATDFDALTLRNGDGTVGSAAVLGFEASTGTLGDDATLAAQIKGIRTGGGTSGALAFWTNNAGVPAESARITPAGNLLVGRTEVITFSANSADGVVAQPNRLDVSSASVARITQIRNSTGALDRFYNGATVVGSINCTTSSTSYATSSDYRLKEDWQPMTGASERVKALKPVNFAWKVDGSRVDGFLAHEAQAVVPEAVSGVKDAVDADGNPEYQGIDQSKLVPLLTAALQEALAKIDDLTARVSALEATNV